MDFAAALARSERRPGTACATGIIRDQLNEKDRAEFDAALISRVPLSAIARALELIGHKATVNSLTRHRSRECHCWDK
jgi:hypothetical protein